jgi:hypothetical protein
MSLRTAPEPLPLPRQKRQKMSDEELGINVLRQNVQNVLQQQH